MLFTEDNLKKFRITKNGNFWHKGHNVTYYYRFSCEKCGHPFLSRLKNGIYCTKKCARNHHGTNNPMYGKHHSVNTKNKISIALSGKNNPRYCVPLTNEVKEKISKSLINKDRSGEHRKKLSENHANVSGSNNPFYGKKHTDDAKRRISKNRKNIYVGIDNHNWKGGISCEPYCQQWTDREYKNWLKYKRDNGRCQNSLCEHKSSKLVLHHINYDKKDCRPANLITLCNSCNARANYDRDWHTAFYNEIIKRKHNYV